MQQVHLPFWSFFHAIEKTLSYERWIDKYEHFLQVVTSADLVYEKNHETFISFCKALYLQDIRDEKKFLELLGVAIEKEKNWLLGELRKTQKDTPSKKIVPDEALPKKEPEQQQAKKQTPQAKDEISTDDELEEEEKTEPSIKPEYVTGNYQLVFEQTSVNTSIEAKNETVDFLQTDEYFPVTRRQMVKGWQFLRRKEAGGFSDRFDINGTIRQIAKDGTFLYPKYHPGIRNREDTIIIFADYRGSMMAFHELTDRLIASAREGGGHPDVPVFYYHNFPVGNVYRNSNLTDPVDFSEALRNANRNFTLAFVISDAGAARGIDPTGAAIRAAKTAFMLERLNRSCAHTIWLNPMPAHRWKNTAAELISNEVFVMAPLMENNAYNFQDMMRTILKQKLIMTP